MSKLTDRTPSEQDYIFGILKNDRLILQTIYAQFLPGIVVMVKKNQGTTEDARDIFQDAIVIIFKKANDPDFTLNASFYNYLYGICRFLWLRQLKKKYRQEVTLDGSEGFIPEESFEYLFEEEEKRKLFLEKFSLLGAECQKTLQLFFDGYTLKEISEKLNYSEQYAKRKKFKCKEQLMKLIKFDPRYSELKKNG